MAGEAIAIFGLVHTILASLETQCEWGAESVALYTAAGCWFTSATSFANPAITLTQPEQHLCGDRTEERVGLRP